MLMSTATAIHKPTVEADGDQCVEFPAIGWEGYLTLLRLRGEGSTPRLVYLDGTVWLMSPSCPHDRLTKRLGWFVEEIVRAFAIPCIATASTTFRRRAKKGGSAPDQVRHRLDEGPPPLGPPDAPAAGPAAGGRSPLRPANNKRAFALVGNVEQQSS
jgi:hypothetical protein